jgi:hypothetical protein
VQHVFLMQLLQEWLVGKPTLRTNGDLGRLVWPCATKSRLVGRGRRYVGPVLPRSYSVQFGKNVMYLLNVRKGFWRP